MKYRQKKERRCGGKNFEKRSEKDYKILISVKLVPGWFGLYTENASLSIEFSKIKQQSDLLRNLN